MPRSIVVLLVGVLSLTAPTFAEPPPEHGFAQSLQEFYRDHGGGPQHLNRWGLRLTVRGALSAEEGQQLHESLDSFYRQAAEMRKAREMQALPALLPVRETLALNHERAVIVSGKLEVEERELFQRTVVELKDRLAAVAPSSVPTAPKQDPAAFRRLVPEIEKFYADAAQRMIDLKMRKIGENEFNPCSICDLLLDSCLDRAGRNFDQCISLTGDFAFCLSTYINLITVCHNEHLTCLTGLCS